VVEAQALVGECPVWSVREQALYWIDIKGQTINRHRPSIGADTTWSVPESVGSIALRQSGGLITAMASGFHRFDPQTGRLFHLLSPEPNQPGNRLNDGKCDRRGRFWAGSMDNAEKDISGALYRFDPDGSCHAMKSGIHLSNGLDWSPDDRVMYLTDTLRRLIWAYDFDVESGTISNEQIFARVDDKAGYPDGLCVDEEGGVWSAHWDGWRLTRYLPGGQMDRIFPMPVPRPSSCAFGGTAFDVLYVTTATIGLDATQLRQAPHSGSVLALQPGIRGLAPSFFGD